MFSIFVIDCTLYYDATSVDCGNFTLYSMPVCDAYCWKAIWLICSILTATICICLMRKSLFPELRPFGYTAIWKHLIRKPYFWSLNSITSLAIIYDILIMYQNRDAKIYIQPKMQRLSGHLREVVTYIYRTTVGPFREDRGLNTSAFWNRIHCMQFLIYNMCSFIPRASRGYIVAVWAFAG